MRLVPIAAACVLLSFAGNASAFHFFGAPEGDAPAPDEPFVASDTDACRWPDGAVGAVAFLVDASSTTSIGDALFSDVVAARARWNAIATARDVLGAPSSSAEDLTAANFGTAWGRGFAESGSGATADGLNEIVLDEAGDVLTDVFGLDPAEVDVLALTSRQRATGGCEIVDALVVVDAAVAPGERRAALVHALGHAQGLAHASVGQFSSRTETPGAGHYASPSIALDVVGIADVPSMHPFAAGTDGARETPEADDAAGLSVLYPTPGFATATGAIEGRVTRCEDGSTLAGVNVRAVSVDDPRVQVSRYTAVDGSDDGRFRIAGLPPGAYRVVVEPMGRNGFTPARMAIATPIDSGFVTEYYGPDASSEAACSESLPDGPAEVAVAAGTTSSSVDVRVVGADLAWIVDDTNSMANELASLADVLDTLVSEEGARGLPDVAILTFADDVTLRVVSDDPETLRNVVASLEAKGGLDCPESAHAALLAAGALLRAGGRALLFTDAAPRPDGPTTEAVSDYYRARAATVSALVSDTCSGGLGRSALASPSASGDAEPAELGGVGGTAGFAVLAAETGGVLVKNARPLPGTEVRDTYVGRALSLAKASVGAAVVGVTPDDAPDGGRPQVVIHGVRTSWNDDSQVSFGAGVRVVAATTEAPDRILVDVEIDAAASPGPRDVSVTTRLPGADAEVATGRAAFVVRPAGGRELLSAVPTATRPGSEIALRIRGFGTSFEDDTPVTLIDDEVVVDGVTGEGPESLVADVTVTAEAARGVRSIIAGSGSEATQFVDAVVVADLAPDRPRIGRVVPVAAEPGTRTALRVIGQSTAFVEGVSVLAVDGGGVLVEDARVVGPTEIVATLDIAESASRGRRAVRVVTGDEQAVLLSALRIGSTPRSDVVPVPADGRIAHCMAAGERVELAFDVESPGRLDVVVRSRFGALGIPLAPELSLVPPAGSVRPLGRAKRPGARVRARRVGLTASGEHRIRIEAPSGVAGCFKARVRVRPAARSRLEACVEPGRTTTLVFDASGATRLDARARGREARPSVAILSPIGVRSDFAGRGRRRARLRDFALEPDARYRLVVGSESPSGDCVRVVLRRR